MYDQRKAPSASALRTRDAERALAAGLEHAQEGGQRGDLLEVVHQHQHAHVVGALYQLYAGLLGWGSSEVASYQGEAIDGGDASMGGVSD